jgi:hypothetical protein
MRFTAMHNTKPNFDIMLNNIMIIMHTNNYVLVGGMGEKFSSTKVSTFTCSS